MQNLKSQVDDKKRNYKSRKIRVGSKIKSMNPDFRVVINKTNRYLKAQTLDTKGQVVASICDKKFQDNKIAKIQSAESAGEELAALLKKKNVKKIVFDRNGHLYHGRVKAFADGLRKGGMQF